MSIQIYYFLIGLFKCFAIELYVFWILISSQIHDLHIFFFSHSVGCLGWMWTKLMVFKPEFCLWVPYSCVNSHRWFHCIALLPGSWLLFSLSCMCCAVLRCCCVQLFATSWTIARQAPLFMGILQARILEYVAMPSSRGSSQPRGRTQVSCIAGGYFTIWTTREAHRAHRPHRPLPLSLIPLF